MRWLSWLWIAVALACPGRALAHGGTSHSPDMRVENELVIGPSAITIVQVHHCTGKIAEDLWSFSDENQDGQLSAAELAKCQDGSRTVFQQYLRLEVDWKTVLPARVDVELTSFPRTRPATFAAPFELVIKHVGRYELPEGGAVRNVGLNVTSLNARVIATRVVCEPGVYVETASVGTIARSGQEVRDIRQEDGLPDQIALVVRRGAATAPAGGAPAIAAALALLAAGFWLLVSRSIAYGRAAQPSGAPIAFGFAVIAAGAAATIAALVSAGYVKLSW